MNTIAKLSVAGVLSLGYVSAHAAFVSPTSTSPGDVLLFAEVLNSSGSVIGSYAGDSGVAVTKSLASGTLISASNDANLQQLITLGTTGTNTIEWAVEGGGGTNPNGSAGQYGVTGNAAFLTTLTSPTGLAGTTGVNLNNWHSLGGVQGSTGTVPTINTTLGTNSTATSIFGTATASAGVWDTTNLNSNVQNWYQNGANTAQTGLTGATASTLYYVTGGGTNGSQNLVSSIGSVSLTADGLTFTTGQAAVPLPAAFWLLGGGLLGLVGVGRRKSVAA
jgi:hypothetical protein